MNFQLTDAAVALLNGATGPIVLTTYSLGDEYGYIPEATDTNIHGQEVYGGTPSAPIVVNANVVKYSIYLDYDIGPFEFGELGIFVQVPGSGSILFALGTGSELISKIPLSTDGGNSIRADIYLSMVGTNYEMWMDSAESNNKFRMAVLGSPDYLPPSQDAVPNTYILDGASSSQSSFLAYTNRSGLWNFDKYSMDPTQFTVLGSIAPSTIIVEYSEPDRLKLSPDYKGHKIVEFSTGSVYSICRYVDQVTQVGPSTLHISFYTPMLVMPEPGDQFFVSIRDRVLEDDRFIPYSEKGEWSGVATIVDGAPGSAPPGPITDYNYKKLPVQEAPRGSLLFIGDWDVSSNTAVADVDGISRHYQLLPNGMMVDEMFSSSPVQANGKIFRVAVGGEFNLDGFSDWMVGDIAIAFGSQWYRLRRSELLRRYQLTMFQDLVHSSRAFYHQKFTESLILANGNHNNAVCINAPNTTNVALPIELNGTVVGSVSFPINSNEGLVTITGGSIAIEAGDLLTIRTTTSVGSMTGLSITLTFNMI